MTIPTQSPPSGWYDDPDKLGSQRYWDGARWTDYKAESRVAPVSEHLPPGTGEPALLEEVVGVGDRRRSCCLRDDRFAD